MWHKEIRVVVRLKECVLQINQFAGNLFLFLLNIFHSMEFSSSTRLYPNKWTINLMVINIFKMRLFMSLWRDTMFPIQILSLIDFFFLPLVFINKRRNLWRKKKSYFCCLLYFAVFVELWIMSKWINILFFCV